MIPKTEQIGLSNNYITKKNIMLQFLKKVKTILFIISLFPLLFACNNSSNNSENKDMDDNQKHEIVEVPDFKSDSAYLFIQEQLKFGPRVPESKAHQQCAEYLVGKLKGYSDTVYEQVGSVIPYTGKTMRIKNIIASFNPTNQQRIIICSHWDSRHVADMEKDEAKRNKPIPGANDGASGVGVIMEIARNLKLKTSNIGVDLILFDAEDYGQPDFLNLPEQDDTWCLGAQYWAKNPHLPNYTAYYGILLDMVGAPNATFYKEKFSMNYAPNIVEKVWQTAYNEGFSGYFINEEANAITDDHFYVNNIAKIPCIDIIQIDKTTPHNFGKYWHTQDDNINAIDKNTLKAVGQTLITLIYNE